MVTSLPDHGPVLWATQCSAVATVETRMNLLWGINDYSSVLGAIQSFEIISQDATELLDYYNLCKNKKNNKKSI